MISKLPENMLYFSTDIIPHFAKKNHRKLKFPETLYTISLSTNTCLKIPTEADTGTGLKTNTNTDTKGRLQKKTPQTWAFGST